MLDLIKKIDSQVYNVTFAVSTTNGNLSADGGMLDIPNIWEGFWNQIGEFW